MNEKKSHAPPIFATAAVLAIIVMLDAMGVRREAGKHAKALNGLTLSPSQDAPGQKYGLKCL